jgi:hypothetical protein
VEFVASSTSFGFTIGATALLMNCIDDIRRYSRDFDNGVAIEPVESVSANILERLGQCRSIALKDLKEASEGPLHDAPDKNRMAFHHLITFISAAHIYLHRVMLNKSPRNVQEHITEVFRNINAFYAIGDGNPLLWPAFIAAVEVYEDNDIAEARSWMKRATKVGMGNRDKAITVIEEVWRVRKETAIQTGQDIGDVVVDWRQVMLTLGLDILLI